MKASIKNHYKQRIDSLSKLKKMQEKILRRILFARVFSFLFVVSFFVLAIYWNESAWLFGVIPFLFLFGVLVKKNRNENELLLLIKKKIECNEEELLAISGNFSSFENGKEFLNTSHEFSHDLDVFGENSLFQAINRTSSPASSNLLAKLLAHPFSDKKTIRTRQVAVEELENKPNWREDFRAKGNLYFTHKKSIDLLSSWNAKEIPLFENKTIWKFLFLAIPIFMISVIIFAYYAIIPIGFLLVAALIPLGITGKHLKTINSQHAKISSFSPILKQHSLLANKIEEETFGSDLLITIQKKLLHNESFASVKINELAQLTNQFDNRSNPIFALLANALFLWDLRYLFGLKKWLTNNDNGISNWFEATHEMETYLSLATFAFNNPTFSRPQLSQENLFESKELAHPLMQTDNRIANDFEINTLQEFVVVTGANMAGKSTFLRAVGINLVLANCGAPVCASYFKFKPTQLFSSMRTSDSLSNNESYFYSELKRLQTIVEKLKKGETLFVILDEILKGTNSKDKAEGSKKFIKQLLNYQVSGIIATHDLSLCSLKEEFPLQITNKYFDVEIENDKLVFDYTLKQGICSNMNAEFLMKKMGITE